MPHKHACVFGIMPLKLGHVDKGLYVCVHCRVAKELHYWLALQVDKPQRQVEGFKLVPIMLEQI